MAFGFKPEHFTAYAAELVIDDLSAEGQGVPGGHAIGWSDLCPFMLVFVSIVMACKAVCSCSKLG